MTTADTRLRRTAAAVYFLAWALFGLEVALIPYQSPAQFAWLGLFVAGLAAGLLYWHRYRALGWILYASSLSLVVVAWGAVSDSWMYWNAGLAGLSLGVAVASAERFLRPSPVGVLNLSSMMVVFLVGALPFLLYDWIVPIEVLSAYRIAAVAVAAILALLAWLHLFRPWFELMVEPPLWWMFHIRGAGPGLRDFPTQGPCIVIANHGCWFDPIMLAKLLPRPLTPMMTGRYYDLPILSWLMRRFGIIKVREQSMRRELPELQEAIAALDRGECLVVFPEGYLRRSEDRPLKRFGRGVWEILKARPHTPVYACWIEGNWGSYTSYFNGKPTENKRRDRRRPIQIGVCAAEVLEPDILAHHLRTRLHLMNCVIEARQHILLPELPPYPMPSRDDDEVETDQS